MYLGKLGKVQEGSILRLPKDAISKLVHIDGEDKVYNHPVVVIGIRVLSSTEIRLAFCPLTRNPHKGLKTMEICKIRRSPQHTCKKLHTDKNMPRSNGKPSQAVYYDSKGRIPYELPYHYFEKWWASESLSIYYEDLVLLKELIAARNPGFKALLSHEHNELLM